MALYLKAVDGKPIEANPLMPVGGFAVTFNFCHEKGMVMPSRIKTLPVTFLCAHDTPAGEFAEMLETAAKHLKKFDSRAIVQPLKISSGNGGK